MRIDSYTKVVLTVIAACLAYICLDTTSVTVSAQDPDRVYIAGWVDHEGFVHSLPRDGRPNPVAPLALPVNDR